MGLHPIAHHQYTIVTNVTQVVLVSRLRTSHWFYNLYFVLTVGIGGESAGLDSTKWVYRFYDHSFYILLLTPILPTPYTPLYRTRGGLSNSLNFVFYLNPSAILALFARGLPFWQSL